MTDAISSVSTSSAASTRSNSSAVKEDTKNKLKALGLDPSKYTTETQAQSALTQAQEAQAAKQSKPAQSGNSEESIKNEISSLAASIGVSVGTNDKIDDIMDKVSAQIDELTSQAGTDTTKKSSADNYERQYATISSEFSQMQAAKNMTGATALASYAKASLGLS